MKHVQLGDVANERIDRSPGFLFCWHSRQDHVGACGLKTTHHVGKEQGACSSNRGDSAKVEDQERCQASPEASRHIVDGGERMRPYQFDDMNVLVVLFQNFLGLGQAAAFRSDGANVVVGNH